MLHIYQIFFLSDKVLLRTMGITQPWPFCQTPLQLANPTQLLLVGVGVEFVIPKKKNKKNTPHLASIGWPNVIWGV